jgi:hypothetical protein
MLKRREQPSAEQPPAGPRTEPEDWSRVNEVCCVQVSQDSNNNAWRSYKCDGQGPFNECHGQGPFKELIWPVYVPTPASESAGDQDGNKKDDKASGGSPAVSAADKYWADAASQARSTAKWIATSLGAALAAIIGTAPLTPLGGKAVDWLSWPGLAIAGGIALLGVTLVMVTSVLVPGVTFFTNLKGSKDAKRWRRWWRDHLPVCWAQRALGRRAASDHGVLLPIGITSLDELGQRCRLDELTLDKVCEKLAEVPKGHAGKAESDFWEQVKTDRGKILQGYIDESMQWVILANYVAVKVRADLARSIGLALGLVGTVLLVWGYIAIQPSEPAPTANTATYVVLNVSPTSPARTALGGACNAFTGVALRGAPAGKLAIYVTGGKGCKTGRVEVPAGDVGTVQPPSSTPSPKASTSPASRTSP